MGALRSFFLGLVLAGALCVVEKSLKDMCGAFDKGLQ